MLVACQIHWYQGSLFALNGATGVPFCDMPHVKILSDRVKCYQHLECPESSFCAHSVQFVLLPVMKNKA